METEPMLDLAIEEVDEMVAPDHGTFWTGFGAGLAVGVLIWT